MVGAIIPVAARLGDRIQSPNRTATACSSRPTVRQLGGLYRHRAVPGRSFRPSRNGSLLRERKREGEEKKKERKREGEEEAVEEENLDYEVSLFYFVVYFL